jgi:hypothetical protein
VIATGIEKEPFLTVFWWQEVQETVGNGSRNHFVELDHRAEATVLMRSLRVAHNFFCELLIWNLISPVKSCC